MFSRTRGIQMSSALQDALLQDAFKAIYPVLNVAPAQLNPYLSTFSDYELSIMPIAGRAVWFLMHSEANRVSNEYAYNGGVIIDFDLDPNIRGSLVKKAKANLIKRIPELTSLPDEIILRDADGFGHAQKACVDDMEKVRLALPKILTSVITHESIGIRINFEIGSRLASFERSMKFAAKQAAEAATQGELKLRVPNRSLLSHEVNMNLSPQLKDEAANSIKLIDKYEEIANTWHTREDVFNSRVYEQINTAEYMVDEANRSLDSEIYYLEAKTKELADMRELVKKITLKNMPTAQIEVETAYMHKLEKEVKTIEGSVTSAREYLKKTTKEFNQWSDAVGDKMQVVVLRALDRISKAESNTQNLQTSLATRTATTPLAQLFGLLKSAINYLSENEVSQMIISSYLTYNVINVVSQVSSLGMFAPATAQITAPDNFSNVTALSFR
jgi:hypothetical protein